MPGTDLGRPPSDEDRSRTIERLRAASPHLGLEETERRMDLAVRARTVSDLALLVWDIDHSPPDAGLQRRPRPSAWRSSAFRAQASSYALVNSMLVGIWALTGHGFFWPFFPIAGWGIGLGMHAVGAREVQRKRLAKRESRAVDRGGKGSTGAVERPRERGLPPATAPAAARVVVMFSDIVESTRLTMALGDAQWAAVRRRCREMMQECYAECGGREVGSSGDGFLARFDRVEPAAQAALAIRRRLKAQREQTGFAPSVRIGIHAGEAVEEDDGDVIGATVNMAARVTAAAEPDEILVTEPVADRLDGRIRLIDGGLRELKGLDRRVHLLSLQD